MMKHRYFYSAEIQRDRETLWAHGHFTIFGLFSPSGRQVHAYAMEAARQGLERAHGEIPDRPIRIVALNLI